MTRFFIRLHTTRFTQPKYSFQKNARFVVGLSPMIRLSSFRNALAIVRIPASGRSGDRTGHLRSSPSDYRSELARCVRRERTIGRYAFVPGADRVV